MDIAAWLRSLGLDQYEPAFRENEIDGDVLPKLTSEDLKDLGVLAVGHRRKILAAIAALGVPEPAASGRGGSPVANAIGAERRQLTVMFCDLVGSTALAAAIDPEEMGDVIRAYQVAATGAITRFGGHVAKFMGDGILCYFGWPVAHEDEAERAVRAGLAVVAAVGALRSPQGTTLAARIGIATGLVVVGDLVGSGEAQERAVVGETPNLAARLQAAAEPGSVLVSEATRRLLGTDVDLAPAGLLSLKGIAAPVAVHRVRGLRESVSRFDAHQSKTSLPMIGRDRELAALRKQWEKARGGEGQCLVLIGEPGIGKSRLTRALRDIAEQDGCVTIRYQCSPYHQDSPLWPAIQQLSFAAGFTAGEAEDSKRAKLRTLLRRAFPDEGEALSLIGALLGLEPPEEDPQRDLSPQERRTRTLHALVDQLIGLAGGGPVLVVVEDAHWIDPSTLELLERALERTPYCPVLMLLTARPPFEVGLCRHAEVVRLTLTRLDRNAIGTIIDNVAGGKALPAEIVDAILARTDGVPLFVEEVTRAVLESGLLDEEEDTFRLKGPLPPLAIPSSLYDSLMSRLDRLQPVKQVAQTAACIGRDFSYRVLAAVATMPEDRLAEALMQLQEAELIFAHGAPPEAEYSFKHALVRDTAYQSLLKSRREKMHRRIAEQLVVLEPGIADSQPELLAQHYTEAGLVEAAVEHWWRAGARSAARFAHREAASHYARALELLSRLPPGRERDEREIALRLAYVVPLIATHGFGSSAVWSCAGRAKELCDGATQGRTLFAVHRAVWNSSLMREPVPQTVTLAHELMRLALRGGDPAQLAAAHRAVGYSLQIAGRLHEADGHLAEGIALADRLPDEDFTIYGEHPGMVCRVYQGWGRCIMGSPQDAGRLADAAIAHARERGNPHALAWALVCTGFIAMFARDAPLAATVGAEALAIAREHRLPQWLAFAQEVVGWAACAQGDGGGLDVQEEALRTLLATGAVLHTTRMRHCLAEGCLAFGRLAAARAHLSAGYAHRDRYGEDYLAAELHRLDALLLQAEGAPADEADRLFDTARRIAREQGASLLELRAAVDQARGWLARGDRQRPQRVLAPLLARFDGLGDGPDVREARALLASCRRS
ncbi:adenylate/guanylate cyclase domain-containing protein [Azospirillum rugosum]|uniref:Class 3 adenylate cyclase/energy-coupling factor transporter ATP-binding protein EcfA2/tetratricopeptide (TPR) repeat protein n=1 Tax=Azospirillum rugosum TaxID=416170 RepID=A0ABS4SUG0_9PROT|nr:adenylate/guanylate cyclase domain-containing protein [Azospirillum rugosum]MBP2295733.1 class 3 adenylate cyclase/energy-coupling factor transporter ATP-binding protein EcfA2/tetratricopeptide (TPR) repeat protein [Azospirillum rugosum]MDQ0529156.1 class 3 adenylate cyclase/energy-coupling factor transporter ATP-binding protein EcfA2/tetratricopeptide (TPR) repeat protein [Azospirillum rugosum]